MTMHGALDIVCDNGGKFFLVTGEILCRVSTKLYVKLFHHFENAGVRRTRRLNRQFNKYFARAVPPHELEGVRRAHKFVK